jgi:hypothetical protein
MNLTEGVKELALSRLLFYLLKEQAGNVVFFDFMIK